MTPPPERRNPLATDDQFAAESLAARLFNDPAVRAVREEMRPMLLADPVCATMDGAMGVERALDLWTRCLCFREANADPYRPKVTWSVDDIPHEWPAGAPQGFWPGGGMGIDNTDNVYREIPICGDSEYVIHGRYSANPTTGLSFQLEEEPFDHAGILPNLFILTTQEIVADAEGRFTLTVSRDSAEGRVNHIRIADLPSQTLFIRDSRADWRQQVTELNVTRTAGPPAPPARSYEQIRDRVVAFLPSYLRYWSTFKDSFLGSPEFNTLIGPVGRSATWGYMAGGRFHLSEEDCLVITAHDGGARYRGFQICDPWTMAPDPVWRQTSLNSAQRRMNPDGTTTYVLSLVDPGVWNWLDTAGLTQGWYLTRWQGFDGMGDPSGLVLDCRLVRLDELDRHLPEGCPMATTADRRAQILDRVRTRRIATGLTRSAPPPGGGIRALQGKIHD